MLIRELNDTKKRVLVLGINFKPELTGIGKYTGEMTEWLVENGYSCTVVTSFPYYPNWKIQKPYRGLLFKKEVKYDGRLQIYRCPLYVPGLPSGLKRILQELTFFLTSLVMLCYLLFKKGHQQIFCMAPPFHLGFLAIFYRFFKGGEIVYHIQDLQIEASRDLQVIRWKGLFSLLFALEKTILKQVNFVSTISDGMCKKIADKVNKKVLFFPNWVDTDVFFPLASKLGLKERWGFKPSDILVLYSGSIGEKQGLDSLINIAKQLKGEEQIKFIISGNGPYKEKLSQLALDAGLNNVHFLSLQPVHLFNEFLNMADVHLILQKKNVCDLVMPSKLLAILSSGGLPLVTAEEGTSLHTVIKKHEMGLVVACEEEESLKKAILDSCSSDYSKLVTNGRRFAEEFLNRNYVIQNLMSQLEGPKIVDLPKLEYADLKNA
ncbi:WcaI family glycosyltransferase [Olivibacter sp. SDN3]|uniref:WcaI family glycosyltransferase n=1 Tax=Olivibacter sp. SDN3 TaxID=2764720 RepID=UPI0016512501|nr:WcaI family glycosyltransferase [Olivibacter sp. SDN3]QNL51724.1 WcaI family glycosyltransferase [Olivibacter sp. SDN3]